MAENNQKTVAPDRSRTSSSKEAESEDYEIEYWSRKSGVEPQRLRDAVANMGNSPKADNAALTN
jgi:hypothetical protein